MQDGLNREVECDCLGETSCHITLILEHFPEEAAPHTWGSEPGLCEGVGGAIQFSEG